MKESANPKKPLLVYGDWALQDWDDGPMLSEALTLANLETLRGWKERHGVAFDYYIIDARWYAPDSLLRFDPEHWPRGFAEARRAMEALGTRVGLWYCISRSLVNDPRWAASLTDSGGQYSLSHGPYLEGLEEALEHAYAEFGLRMVKWDFAEFAAKAREQSESDRASLRAANIGAFNRMVDRFRARHPETLQLAYNGFAHVPGAIDHTSPTLIPSIDPKFLDHFDWLYSGDPRPADVPMTSFWRAVDVYQDHQVRRWHASGYPLDRIDDHGCMLGPGLSIYSRGAQGWRATWVLHLSRGTGKAHLYGDPRLLTDEDVEFLKTVLELFGTEISGGARVSPVGGVPGAGEWYGWLTGSGARGLLSLVNPAAISVEAELPLADLAAGDARIVFSDSGRAVDASASAGVLRVSLGPEQMALLALGALARTAPSLGTDLDLVIAHRSTPLPVQLARTGPVTLRGTVPAPGSPALRLSLQAVSEQGAYRRCRWESEKMVHEIAALSVEQNQRRVCPALTPARPPWSGCSWVSCELAMKGFDSAKPLELSVFLRNPPNGVRWEATAHAVGYG